MRLFRSDLFCDVEIYRPWLDDRYRFPNACIGEKDEVRDAFEANLIPVLNDLSANQSCFYGTVADI